MDKTDFYKLVEDPDKYVEVTDLHALEEFMGCVVRIKHKRDSSDCTKYLSGGVLTHVDPEKAWVKYKGLSNHKTYRLRVDGVTFYAMRKPKTELDAWVSFANNTFGPDTVHVTKLQ